MKIVEHLLEHFRYNSSRPPKTSVPPPIRQVSRPVLPIVAAVDSPSRIPRLPIAKAVPLVGAVDIPFLMSHLPIAQAVPHLHNHLSPVQAVDTSFAAPASGPKTVEGEKEIVKEAEGYTLRRSSRSKTGYSGVTPNGSGFQAKVGQTFLTNGSTKLFPTAVAAAVARFWRRSWIRRGTR